MQLKVVLFFRATEICTQHQLPVMHSESKTFSSLNNVQKRLMIKLQNTILNRINMITTKITFLR